MLIRKPRSIALTWLLFVAGAGAGRLDRALAMNDEPGSAPAGRSSPAAAKPDDTSPDPAPGRMFVVGRVLDPDGKPVPGATVAVYALSLAPGRTHNLRTQRPIGDARTDGSGRFRIDAPRTSSAQYEDCGVVALAPGFGAGWTELDPDDERPAADVALRPEQVIHGRLFDVQGRPAAGVTVSVASIRREPRQRGIWNRYVSVYYGVTTINDLPAWPRPAISDSDGRFTLRGAGGGLHAMLSFHHPRFAIEAIDVAPDDASKSKAVTAALRRPRSSLCA